MNEDLELNIKHVARSMSVLLVDDDELTLEMYKSIFSEWFLKVFTASDGQEAFDIWRDQTKKIDLIITDMMMPRLNGFELVDKVREHSSSQHIIVLTSLDDLNEMRAIINLGVEGIILKPYTPEKVLPVLNRVLEVIKTKKVMKRQIFQLKLLSQENIALKAQEKQHNEESLSAQNKVMEPSPTVVKVKKESALSSKYNIRKTIIGSNANELNDSLFHEYESHVDSLIQSIVETEAFIISLESETAENIIDELKYSTQSIEELVEVMNSIGSFNVAVEAAENLIQFIQGIELVKLEDTDKRELFFDAYLSMFQDIEKWLNTVFIRKEASNINYFDASFANTCLELETIFTDIIEDDSELEFF